MTERRDCIAPEIDIATGFVMLFFGVLCIVWRLEDPYDTALIFGQYLGIVAGLVLFHKGLDGLLDDWSGDVSELGGEDD